MWLAQSTAKLVRFGHSRKDIANYDLGQFVIFLDAAEQIEAAERIAFVADLTSVVGSLFSKESAVGKHLDVLEGIVTGE